MLLSDQKCLTVKGDLADWAYAMPRDQSVFQVVWPLRDETLLNCVNLKETLVSLGSLKFLMKCSKTVSDSNDLQIHCFNVCCLDQSYG